MNLIKPPHLHTGDTVGILAPSYGVDPDAIAPCADTLRSLGFRVVYADHLFSHTDGYAGSAEERAADFNAMIADDRIHMLLFGGGEVSNEILPLIDYDSVRRHPKIICSYSDSTTVLNALHAVTGLVTFYGTSPGTFRRLNDYNYESFEARILQTGTDYRPSAPWRCIWPGVCRGHLSGGYLVNYAAMLGLPQYTGIPEDPCILFIEDHEQFSTPAMVSKWFSHLAQHNVFDRVQGLIFGHYASHETPEIDAILRRIGRRYRIPVVRCEDFGHGDKNAILPIGVQAELDADNGCFTLLESGAE